MSGALCAACQRIFEGRSRRFSNLNLFHHYNRASLIEHAANQGCTLCQEIWDNFSLTEKEDLRSSQVIPWLKTRPPFDNSRARVRRSLRSSERGQAIMGDDWDFDEYVWSVHEDGDDVTVTFKFGNRHESGSWRNTSFEIVKVNSKYNFGGRAVWPR